MTYTSEKIEAWKKEHGELFMITVENKNCILKKPTRKILSYAMAASKDVVKMNEILINQCWVAGDDEIKTDDTLFMAACTKLDVLLEVKEAEIKKL